MRYSLPTLLPNIYSYSARLTKPTSTKSISQGQVELSIQLMGGDSDTSAIDMMMTHRPPDNSLCFSTCYHRYRPTDLKQARCRHLLPLGELCRQITLAACRLGVLVGQLRRWKIIAQNRPIAGSTTREDSDLCVPFSPSHAKSAPQRRWMMIVR